MHTMSDWSTLRLKTATGRSCKQRLLQTAKRRRLPTQGSRSYASCIDFFAEAQLAHLNKTTSCEVEVATGQSESDVIRVAAGALSTDPILSYPVNPG